MNIHKEDYVRYSDMVHGILIYRVVDVVKSPDWHDQVVLQLHKIENWIPLRRPPVVRDCVTLGVTFLSNPTNWTRLTPLEVLALET